MFKFSSVIVTSVALALTTFQSVNASEGKAWKHENAKLFDVFLRANPVTLYRIHKSSKTIQETNGVLKTAQQNRFDSAREAEFVKAQLEQALVLVKPFINDIRGYKDLILPLLTESYAVHGIKNAYMSRFLSGSDTLEVFTAREVKTVEALQGLLQEIHGFFADLFASLSKETKDAYKAFVAKQSKQ